MTPTKGQELQTLKQIERLVDSLGESSYIGIAMEGVLEDCQSNIENERVDSMKGRYLKERKEKNELRKQNATLRVSEKHLSEALKKEQERYGDLLRQKEGTSRITETALDTAVAIMENRWDVIQESIRENAEAMAATIGEGNEINIAALKRAASAYKELKREMFRIENAIDEINEFGNCVDPQRSQTQE